MQVDEPLLFFIGFIFTIFMNWKNLYRHIHQMRRGIRIQSYLAGIGYYVIFTTCISIIYKALIIIFPHYKIIIFECLSNMDVYVTRYYICTGCYWLKLGTIKNMPVITTIYRSGLIYFLIPYCSIFPRITLIFIRSNELKFYIYYRGFTCRYTFTGCFIQIQNIICYKYDIIRQNIYV
ncbi:pI177L [African swine fever virus]|uniref:PI177L n=1 Tax=African swine fever virus TaxID=10497 RepID=A0A894KS42_ASF|nr:pI177L [African swine fever virus]